MNTRTMTPDNTKFVHFRDLRADKRFGGRSKESLFALDDVGDLREQSSQVSTKSKFAPRHFR